MFQNRIEDTNDLRQFMLELKKWCQAHGESEILALVETAEKRGMSASELLLAYSDCLREIHARLFNRLPEQFRVLTERGIRVAQDAANLGSYTYKAS